MEPPEKEEDNVDIEFWNRTLEEIGGNICSKELTDAYSSKEMKQLMSDTHSHSGNICNNAEEADKSVPDNEQVQNVLTSHLPPFVGGKSKDHLQSTNWSNASENTENLPKSSVNVQFGGKVLPLEDEGIKEIKQIMSDTHSHSGNICNNAEEADKSVPDNEQVQNVSTSHLPPFVGGKSKDHLQSTNWSNASENTENLPKSSVNVQFGGKVLLLEDEGIKWIYVQPDVPIPIIFENIRKNSNINLKLVYDKISHQNFAVKCSHNCPSDYQKGHEKDFELKIGQTISKDFLSTFYHSFSVENEVVLTFHQGQCDIPVKYGGNKRLNLRLRCKNSCFPSKEFGTDRKLIISLTVDGRSDAYLEKVYALHVRDRPDRDIKNKNNKRCRDQNTGQKKRKQEDSG